MPTNVLAPMSSASSLLRTPSVCAVRIYLTHHVVTYRIIFDADKREHTADEEPCFARIRVAEGITGAREGRDFEYRARTALGHTASTETVPT